MAISTLPPGAKMVENVEAPAVGSDEGKYWIFTFGAGSPIRDYYVVVYALSSEDARITMLAAFGKNWASQYDANRGDVVVRRYNLIRLIALNHESSDSAFAREMGYK